MIPQNNREYVLENGLDIFPKRLGSIFMSLNTSSLQIHFYVLYQKIVGDFGKTSFACEILQSYASLHDPK